MGEGLADVRARALGGGVGVRLSTCEARERPRKWRTDSTSWGRRLGAEDISF